MSVGDAEVAFGTKPEIPRAHVLRRQSQDAFFFDFHGLKNLFDTRGRNFTGSHFGGKSALPSLAFTFARSIFSRVFLPKRSNLTTVRTSPGRISEQVPVDLNGALTASILSGQ
jgi:hypothetical protein